MEFDSLQRLLLIYAATPLMHKEEIYPKYSTNFAWLRLCTSLLLLMIPVIFIIQGKAWNKKTMSYVF